MPAVADKPDALYTYADILNLNEKERCELLNGQAYMMAPPLRIHQDILGALFNKLYSFLEGKPCKVYPAPFGVRLFPQKNNSDTTYFEPDIVVVCDTSKLDERGCNGAPDMVVEILSPSTMKFDLLYKLNKYLEAGVREYWIVDPEEKIISVYVFEGGRITFCQYDSTAILKAAVLPGFSLVVKTIFPEAGI